jgi:hypothetical protein
MSASMGGEPRTGVLFDDDERGADNGIHPACDADHSSFIPAAVMILRYKSISLFQ